LGSDITVDDVEPACTNTRTGEITLRGHVTLSPVPAIGGMLIGILPRDSSTGECPCSLQDNGFEVIGTTTGLAFSNATGNAEIPDVCIVRLLVSRVTRYDVTRDFIIDADDVRAIRNDPAYVSNPNGPSNCTGSCGVADVNLDGKVNQFDATAVTEAVSSTRFPVDVRCGAVQSTAFSCGSTRASPLVPAVGISLDTIKYFDNDGTLASKKKRSKRDSIDSSELDELLKRADSFVARDELQQITVSVDTLEAQLENYVPKSDFETLMSETREEREVGERQHMVTDVAVAAAAVAAIGVAVFVLKKRRGAVTSSA